MSHDQDTPAFSTGQWMRNLLRAGKCRATPPFRRVTLPERLSLASEGKDAYIEQLIENMSSLNKWLGLGNLTADPQRENFGAMPVATFTMAINERFSGSGVHSTVFVRVVAQGKRGDSVMTFLKKGRQVLVEGKLQIEQYEDRDHVKHQRPTILADNIQFLGDSGGTERRGEPRMQPEH